MMWHKSRLILRARRSGELYGKTDHPERGVVLFCHGAFETQENWRAFADRLNQDGFAVFAFDFAGHGGSEGVHWVGEFAHLGIQHSRCHELFTRHAATLSLAWWVGKAGGVQQYWLPLTTRDCHAR